MWASSRAGGGIRDNFLNLGGDSILGARLLARVTGELHAELSVVSLFDRPTLEEMARTVADHQCQVPTAAPGRNERRPSIVKVDRQSFRVQRAAPAERAPSLDAPLSFGQQRLWFVDQWRPGTGVFNSRVPIWLSGPLHVAALEQSLATVVRRHGSLRTSFPAADGQPVQRVASALSVPLPVIDLRELPEDSARPRSTN
jgi:hypothetical protein